MTGGLFSIYFIAIKIQSYLYIEEKLKMEGCGKCFTRGFLIIFNILFVLLGFGCVVAGAVFKYGTDFVKDEVSSVLQEIPTTVIGNVALGNVLNSLAIVFLAVGVIMLVIGALGCFGACCKTRPLLVAYAIVISLILIAQIVSIAMFLSLKPDFDNYMNKGFSKIFEEYTTKETDDPSRALDGMFRLMECCGLNNSLDVTKFPDWNKDNANYAIPQGCCYSYDIGTKNTSNVKMLECLQNPTDDNSFMERGCYNKLEDLIARYSNVFTGVGITVIIVELLCVVFAFCVCCEVQRENNAV